MGVRSIKARGDLGNVYRRHADSPERIAAARRALAAAKLADYIESIVAEAPPLSEAQKDELAVLLRTGKSGAA